MSKILAKARQFIARNARLLERVRFAVAFDGASPKLVAQAVAAYQRQDGGLGFGLEPDVRAETSQPLFVEAGLIAMREAGWRDERFANSLCDYLATVSNEAGLVPPLLIDALSSPHAPHWANLPEAGLNPTAGLCGLLHFQGATHPWLARATEACVRVLIESPPSEAHALHCAARLTEGLADQAAANRILDIIAAALPKAAFFKSDAGCTSYGLTPLHFAPTPESRLAKLFSTQQRLAHLTELKGRQQEDGGWPVSWETTGPAATAEWAALVTLEAVRTLSAYNQLD